MKSSVKIKSYTPVLILLLVAIGVVFLLLYVLPIKHPVPTQPQQGSDIKTDTILPPSQKDILVGDERALFKILLYTDYECPYCHDVSKSIPKWLETYGTSTFAFYLRHLPLSYIHPKATTFALDTECVKQNLGNELAFQFGIFIYQNRNEEEAVLSELYTNTFPQIKKEMIGACRENSVIKQQVESSAHEALVNGFSRTPSFLLYDTKVNRYIFKNPGGGSGIYDSILKAIYRQRILGQSN